MLNELQPADESNADRKALVATPQRFGVLPTRWFWSDDENWRLVRGGFAMFAAIVIIVVGTSGLPIYLVATLPPVVIILALGLLERYIRQRAKARVSAHGDARPLSPASVDDDE